MASKFQLSDICENVLSSVGRGRGAARAHLLSHGSVGRDEGASPVLPGRVGAFGSDLDPDESPVGQFLRGEAK